MLELTWPFTVPIEALGYTTKEFEDFSAELGIVGEIKKEWFGDLSDLIVDKTLLAH